MTLLAALPLAGRAVAIEASAPVRADLEARVRQVQAGGGAYVRGEAIAARSLLPAFYAARGYAPVWTSDARIDDLLGLLATAPDHGLDSRDYNLAKLTDLRAHYAGSRDPALGADLDILLTESLIRFGYHQRYGKVNPKRMEPDWNFTREIRPGQDPLTTLDEALAAPSFEAFLAGWVKRGPIYQNLIAKLAEYRGIAARGGWPTVPAGPTLREGDRDPRVAVIRERLAVTGDLVAAAAPDPDLYDATVAAGVKAFQERHNLGADGVLGAGTLAAMNVPVAVRIDQLRLSLERARWVLEDATGNFIVVNIAGYEVFVAEDGRVTWWTRAVVGRPARKTPVFRGSMTYLVINPTWTVPPTILRQDVLPKLRQGTGYLRDHNMSVLDRNGRKVDPDAIDWKALGNAVPYTIRQDPGPENSLGRIKFMFPNVHSVFLHDTPSKDLFQRADRLFSSGCIRVEDPLKLAEIVLANPARWNRQSLEAAIATDQTQDVRLPKPWPVLVFYWTAEIDGKGRARFLKDVYGRDKALLAALNGEVRIELPAAPR